MISAVTGDVTGAMVYGAKIAHMLAQLRYSRQDEEEADREGCICSYPRASTRTE
jgi:predicted Zn-dependent protease